MTVYVGSLFNTPKTKKWPFASACHLLSEDVKELHSFALSIGLKRSWFQSHSIPHYDLTENKRKQALKKGAVSVNPKEEGHLIRKIRKIL